MPPMKAPAIAPPGLFVAIAPIAAPAPAPVAVFSAVVHAVSATAATSVIAKGRAFISILLFFVPCPVKHRSFIERTSEWRALIKVNLVLRSKTNGSDFDID